MDTVTLGARVMRSVHGARPDGPWIVRADLTDTRGTYLLEDPRYPATATACAVTVQAYPHQLAPADDTTHAPCPTHPGQWHHKSTGACSCGACHR